MPSNHGQSFPSNNVLLHTDSIGDSRLPYAEQRSFSENFFPKTLKKLYCCWSAVITDNSLLAIGHLGNLIELCLVRFIKATDRGILGLIHLKKLQSLDLSQNYITDDSLKYFPHLNSLKYLNLTNTNVTERGIQNLVRMTSIRTVETCWMNWTVK